MIDREGQMKLDDIDFNIERLEKELRITSYNVCYTKLLRL